MASESGLSAERISTSTKETVGPMLDKEALLHERKTRIGHNVALNYKSAPLLIMRGKGQWLYDEKEEPYLDCVNNVSHLGHAHPAFVQAAQEQIEVLHTNSRYLHPAILTYAKELSSTLPAPPLPHPASGHAPMDPTPTPTTGRSREGACRQWVMFWVNTGSEANDLALRLARAHTGRTGIICVEGAYHGHTLSVLDISPYKYDIPGGEGRARHVRETTLPCMSTGRYRLGGKEGLTEEDCARLYAADVSALCRSLQAQEVEDEAMACKLREALAALATHKAGRVGVGGGADVPSKGSRAGSKEDPLDGEDPSGGGAVPTPARLSPASMRSTLSSSPSGSTSTTGTGYGSGSDGGSSSSGTAAIARPRARASSSSPPSPVPSASASATGPAGGVDASVLQWALDALHARTRPTEGHEGGIKSGLAAFISESILSCGGQVMPPAGYFTRVYQAVRQAGGVCIADEVQVGFGRVGASMWAFQQGGAEVVPDILTLGKPMGNGFPVAAVLCTPEIAASFAAYRGGQEYFATYGGNPVAGAVALSVLRTIQSEGLQAHAWRVGQVLLDGFRQLQARFPGTIGSVRGCGLMVGVEILQPHRVAALDSLPPATGPTRHAHPAVYSHGHCCCTAGGCPVTAAGLPCPGDRWPDPQLASDIKYAALAAPWRMLLSTDGMADNIIKLKPPMCFSEENARAVVHALGVILGGMGCS